MTGVVFRFLSWITALIGLSSLMLVFVAPEGQWIKVISYSGILLILAGLMLLIPGVKGDSNKKTPAFMT